MRSKTNRNRAAANQQKIKSVIEAIGRPVSPAELAKNPILVGAKLVERVLGANLRILHKRKEIRRLSNKNWAPLKERTAVAVLESKELPKMYFVLIPSEQKILLDVGGMRLPVVIE